jgi:predicted nucleic acid-binding protein
MSGRTPYIDTSALAKWYLNEPRSEDFGAFITRQEKAVISRLTVVEFSETFFVWVAPHLTVVSDVMSDVTSKARRIFNKLQANTISECGDRTESLIESTTYGLVTDDHG